MHLKKYSYSYQTSDILRCEALTGAGPAQASEVRPRKTGLLVSGPPAAPDQSGSRLTLTAGGALGSNGK